MKKGLIISTLAIAMFFLPDVATAQLDPRCFTEEQCIAVRKENGIADDLKAREGFYTTEEAKSICGEKHPTTQKKLGLCLPSTKTITEISFGGRREFANIGEFIQLMYRYGIIIAGILATVIILLGGIRWTASGGNAERIKSAQKMITGSVIGLVLAVLSYSLLNILNPATVNLRLPQVWLVNRSEVNPVYCQAFEEDPGLIPIKRGAELNSAVIDKLRNDFKEGTIEAVPKKATQCGQEYLLVGQGDTTCKGLSCISLEDHAKATGIPNPSKNVCSPQANDQPDVCKPAIITGTISATRGLNDEFADNDILDEVRLYALCRNGDVIEHAKDTNPDGQAFYGINGSREVETKCGKLADLLGFFIGAEVNDETGLTGSGIDDWFAIGQLNKNSGRCAINLSKVAFRLENSSQLAPCKYNECTCALVSNPSIIKNLADNTAFTRHLISAEELRSGYRCDIHINRQEFPRADNTGIKGGLAAAGVAGVIAGHLVTPVGGALVAAVIAGGSYADDPTDCTDKQPVL